MPATTISYQEQFQTDCGGCRQRFTAHVWRIIDLAERPESLSEIADGSVWLQICPSGCRTWAIMPLLVHDPVSEQVVLLVPCDPIRLSEAEENRHADELMAELRRRLPPDIPMGWRTQLGFMSQPAALPLALGRAPITEAGVAEVPEVHLDGMRERVNRFNLTSVYRAYQHATEAGPERRPAAVEAALSLLRPMIRKPDGLERHELANVYFIYGMMLAERPRTIFLKTIDGTLLVKETDPQGQDAVEAIEESLVALEHAANLVDQSEDPVRWATIKHNIAHVYMLRGLTDRGFFETFTVYNTEQAETVSFVMQPNKFTFIKTAIHSYTEALTVFTKDRLPLMWAQTTLDLGTCYAELLNEKACSDRAEVANRAAEAIIASLSILTPEEHPPAHVNAVAQLGNLYVSWPGDDGRRLSEGIELLERVVSAEPTTQKILNLAAAYGRYQGGDRGAYLGVVAELCTRVLAADPALEDEVRACHMLGEAWGEVHDWKESRNALERGLLAIERAAVGDMTEEAINSTGVRAAPFYAGLVRACLASGLGGHADAFHYFARSQARVFRRQLAELPLAPPPHAPAELIASEQRWLREWRQSQVACRRARDGGTRRVAVRAAAVARDNLAHIWAQIGRAPGGAGYLAVRQGELPSVVEVQALLAKAPVSVAVVAVAATHNGPHAFVITRESAGAEVLRLDPEWPQREPAATPSGPARHAGVGPVGGRCSPITSFRADLCALIGAADLVLLVVDAALQNVSVHAAAFAGVPLIDRYPVVYLPTLACLPRLGEALAYAGVSGSACVIGNPTGDLPQAEYEAVAAAELLGCRPLLGADATRERVLEALRTSSVVHIAGHGEYVRVAPRYSGLVLGSGGRLTCEDILDLAIRPDLLVLNCCLTSAVRTDLGEAVGLTTAFLAAGARCTISNMHEVGDAAARCFVEAFYPVGFEAGRGALLACAQSFRQAVQSVRTAFPQTDDWAGFGMFTALA